MMGTGAIKVAAGQLAGRPLEQADEALDAIIDMIRRAGQLGVDLLVLPECAYPAYHIGSRSRYRAAPLLGYPELIHLLSAEARSARVHVAIGLVEPDAEHLYNVALLIGPDGRQIGTYRKQLLWDADHDVFVPGESIEVFDTAIGRIGMLICADARTPEIVATLAFRGADLIAMPTNWVNAATAPGGYYNPQPDFLIPARCREFDLPFVCANKSGQEDDETRFCGLSRVVSPDGATVAEAGPVGETVITAEVAPHRASPAAMVSTCRDRLMTERPAVPPSGLARTVSLAVARSLSDLDGSSCASADLVMVGRQDIGTDTDRPKPAALLHRPAAPGLRTVGGVMIGCAAGSEAQGFAWPRVMALDGAEVLCLFDQSNDLAMLRARAVENRVFVAAATDEFVALIAPDASVLGQDSRLVTAVIDGGQAGVKTVAPRTDVFAARRPRTYEF